MSARLLRDDELERTAVVANCNMNRERRLRDGNGYDIELGLDPAVYLTNIVEQRGHARWLDLCCGSGLALIEASALFAECGANVEITGVDLVDGFATSCSDRLELIAASLSVWEPDSKFDLITCVHGLHYIGNKLGLIESATNWLKPAGLFLANIDSSKPRLTPS